jgi:hypothetical protein
LIGLPSKARISAPGCIPPSPRGVIHDLVGHNSPVIERRKCITESSADLFVAEVVKTAVNLHMPVWERVNVFAEDLTGRQPGVLTLARNGHAGSGSLQRLVSAISSE